MTGRLVCLGLLLLSVFVGGYALASTLSGSAQGCRASQGHWQVMAQACRY